MSDQSVAGLVQDVVTAMNGLKDFPSGDFMNRLYNMSRWSSKIAVFRDKLQLAPDFGPDARTPYIDNQNVADEIDNLAVQSIVAAISSLDDGTDKPNFRSCVKGVSLPASPTAA
jgi:hypothetical protein